MGKEACEDKEMWEKQHVKRKRCGGKGMFKGEEMWEKIV